MAARPDDPETYRHNRDAEETEEARPQPNKFDSYLYVRDHESVTASEFSAWLDRMPKDVSVVLVMVQCYAGGLRTRSFMRPTRKSACFSPHPRCGFFAQLHDRAASGCTADINEADYQEYSSFFWAALAGRRRNGEPVTRPTLITMGKSRFSRPMPTQSSKAIQSTFRANVRVLLRNTAAWAKRKRSPILQTQTMRTQSDD